MKYTFGIILALLVSLRIEATTIPQITASELYKQADTVAIVQVMEGKVIGEPDEYCGAIYKARIIQYFKGDNKKYFYFGHFHGYEIGEKYLLFLTNPDREFRPIASTNSRAINEEIEYREKCGKIQTANKIMHSGYGALKIKLSSEYEYEDAVLVPYRYVSFPESVPRKFVDPGESRRYRKYIWVLEAEAVKYLHSVGKK